MRGLLRARGYEVVRYFSRMVRPLPAAALLSETPPEIADGIRLVTPGDQDSEPLRLVHNVAFRDHWGAGEKSQQAWEHERSARSARPAFDSMAVDAQGEPLSYVLCAQWVPRELYVDVVGTAPQARGAGLARACLSRTIAAAAASGDYNLVDLWVDSASPTGATRLYEGVGFATDKMISTMRRPGPPVSFSAAVVDTAQLGVASGRSSSQA